MTKYFFYFLIIGVLILSIPQSSLAQSQPQTLEEAKSFGWEILNKLPETIKNIWENQAKPIWLDMWARFKDVWSTYIEPTVNVWWDKILTWFGKEPTNINEEFQKEKIELKDDIWERFKGLFD
ncbi:MAG: hypothetical protein ABH805_00490 [Candidatus Nealsonbacteria bacterium]